LGGDSFFGGDGKDGVTYHTSPSKVTVDLKKNVGKGGYAQGDSYDRIEQIEGSHYGDSISGDDNANTFYGIGGNDVLHGRGGRDRLSGGEGNDTIYGGSETDFLSGGNGNDRLFGGDHTDNVNGGDGDDQLFGDDGDDYLIGGNGGDYIDGGKGFDYAYYNGNVSIDMASGIMFGDDASGDTLVNVEGILISDDSVLFGDGGDNSFLLTGGVSIVDGRGGDDHFRSEAVGNTIDGGAGFDEVDYTFVDLSSQNDLGMRIDLNAGTAQNMAIPSRAADQISNIEKATGSWGNDAFFGDGNDNEFSGFVGDDTAFGGAGDDRLLGGEGDDILNGDDGDDTLVGGQGDDILNGGRGNDVLTGSWGADVFQFVNRPNDNDDDVIVDFRANQDKIDFFDDDNMIDSFDEFRDRSSQVGNDTVIDTGAGTITLQNVNRNSLDADDFIF